ncbi:MAG: hypothetical protein H6741_11695 [Alphaproteobacteria bacterium]|nr:hypothetical protein [Alphaproteobacteria bacterium]MCB9793374.1 hypothetical protein [Alphaproteobacteria bacterium]
MRPLPLLAGACSAAALWLTRPAFVDHWDEVQLALGVLDFDLSRHHPHPPGYPGVIALGRALLPLTGDALEALRLSSALALGAWVALVCARLPEDRSWVTRLLLTLSVAALPVLSPLLGYEGRSGLGYAWEALAWTGFALLLTPRAAASPPRAEDSWPRVLGLGLLAGGLGALRPNLSLWAAGLILLQRPRHIGLLALGWVLGVAAWLTPLLALAGGPEAWWAASEGVLTNIRGRSLIHADTEGWLRRLSMPGQLALAVGPLLLLTPSLRRAAGQGRVLIQATALAFLFHLFLIHDTSSYLSAPAACLAAWLLLQAGAWARGPGRAAGVLALVLCGAALPAWPLFERETAPPGEAHDALMRDTLARIHPFRPEETLLVTSAPMWRLGMRHLGWHAPELRVLQLHVDPAFELVRPGQPYLSMQGRALEALGPATGPAQAFLEGPLKQVLLLGPTQGALDPGCAARRLSPWLLALPPEVRVDRGRLRCD